MDKNYLIGRQPILDRNEQIYGYELLFRSTDRNMAEILNPTQASADVLVNTLASFGIRELLGDHRGFVNVDTQMLLHEVMELLPPDQIVIELLETVEPSPEVIARCRDLKNAGYELALDDHQYQPCFAELYEIVDIIKVDLLLTSSLSLPEVISLFRPYQCRLLAEKVETKTIFTECHGLGFDYFQGYYFARPDIIKKKKMDETAATFLKLMRLLSEDAATETIEQAFRSSPILSYKLLTLVNSVTFGGRQPIQGVRHAIAMAGRLQLKRWVQLALFAANGDDAFDHPLVTMAATRATLMEQLAVIHPRLRADRESPDRAFMTGILSLMESIYDISTEDIIANLNLHDEVSAALLDHTGYYGSLLRVIEDLENLQMNEALEELSAIGINPSAVSDLQMRSFNWRTPGAQ